MKLYNIEKKKAIDFTEKKMRRGNIIYGNTSIKTFEDVTLPRYNQYQLS
jgi:hypothetical protein